MPPQPLPEPLRGAEPDSFANDLVAVRLGRIGRQTLHENSFSPAQKMALEALLDEIPFTRIRPIRDRDAPDCEDWEAYTAPYLEMDWFEVPWFFVENYFYRRVLEATGYFQEGAGKGVDPFWIQKISGFSKSLPQIQSLCAQLNRVLRRLPEQGWHSEDFLAMLYSCLWGNQGDLSMWPVGEKQRPDHTDLSLAKDFLLVDDTPGLIADLSKQAGSLQRADFLIDNAGFELVSDLCLADYLLSAGLAEKVRFHLKTHPTFVSDALVIDVEQTISSMSRLKDEATQSVGVRLADHLHKDRLQLTDNWFWNSPLPAWEMPPDLRREFGEVDLVISKGDANYRRAVGDLHWPFTFPFQQVLRFFPAPFLALRVLKSELTLGLAADQLQEMAEKDPKWMVNGRWGMIQYRGS